MRDSEFKGFTSAKSAGASQISSTAKEKEGMMKILDLNQHIQNCQ